MYVALGGSDNNPTKAFNLTYDGNIFHSDGHKFWNSDNMSPAVRVGNFSPVSHNTAGNGWQDIDLSKHYMLTSEGYQNYLTQSGNTLTIVKPGLYHIDLHVLLETGANDAQTDVYLAVTGYPNVQQRLNAYAGWNTIHVSGTFQLVTGNLIVATCQNAATNTYHHHEGPTWTGMHVTFLG
jgi:hypothetical protein